MEGLSIQPPDIGVQGVVGGEEGPTPGMANAETLGHYLADGWLERDATSSFGSSKWMLAGILRIARLVYCRFTKIIIKLERIVYFLFYLKST